MGDPQSGLVELARRSMMDANGGGFGATVAVFAPDAVFDVSQAGIAAARSAAASRVRLVP
jgi:hypothetical protein